MTAFARFTIAALAVLGLLFGVVGLLHASPHTLHETIAAAVPTIGSKREPVVDADELADAVIAVSNGNRQWAALILALGASESAWSERIRLGAYRDREGDSFRDADGTIQHRAWGVLQVHKSTLNASVWGSTVLLDQVREGSRIARGAFFMCKRAGVPFPLGVFRAVGTGSCTMALKGEEQRVALYNRLLRRL